MLVLLSPAKSLDFTTPVPTAKFNQPIFVDDTQALLQELKTLSVADIQGMMKLSDQLSELNHHRFQSFEFPFTLDNARQAAYAFSGDVYQGLDFYTLNKKQIGFAEKHLRILSGLYGLVGPLDLIQPYRLEMGTRFANSRGKDLYQFWGEKIADLLDATLTQQKGSVIVNLASNEYAKAAKLKKRQAAVITPVFKDYKNGQYKIISFFAKKARGLMARFIIENEIVDVEQIKSFNTDGYHFDQKSSDTNNWVFLRKQ